MKNWNDLTDKEKKMLLIYERYLRGEGDDSESMRLTKYCLENNLCVTMIPEKKLYDETYQKIHLQSPFVFTDLYGDVAWVDENGDLIEMV